MDAQKMPNRWILWIALVFVIGLAAGALMIGALMNARRSAGSAVAASDEEKPKKEKDSAPDKDRVRLDTTAQRNVEFAFERVQMRSAAGSAQVTGVVAPNESRVAHIRPLANGRVQQVYVRLGDRVRAGQALATYDNIELGEFTGQYLSALAALEKANAEAEVALRALDRAKMLVGVGALAKAEQDRRTADYANAGASINSQKAELAKLEEKLRRYGLSDEDVRALSPRDGAPQRRQASLTTVAAPFGGVVIKFNAAQGETISPQDELFTIADLTTLWVQADVYEKDIASIRPGQQARIISETYPGHTFVGRITYISDFLDPKTRTAKVRCEVPNLDGRLKVDMFVTIQLPTSTPRQALMIPQAAVQQVNDRPVVFVKVSDTEFDARNVELGPAESGWIEVRKGLKESETVVAAGSFFLKSALMRSQIGGEE